MTYHRAEPEIPLPPLERPEEIPLEVPPLPSEPLRGAVPAPPAELPAPMEPEIG